MYPENPVILIYEDKKRLSYRWRNSDISIIPSECHNSVVDQLFTLKQTFDENNKLVMHFINKQHILCKKTVLYHGIKMVFIINDLQKLSDFNYEVTDLVICHKLQSQDEINLIGKLMKHHSKKINIHYLIYDDNKL